MRNNDYLRETAVKGIKLLEEQGLPKGVIKKMLASARPIADLAVIMKEEGMDYDTFQAFFTKTRRHGVDESIDHPYGGSSIGTMLGYNQYQTPIEIWSDMMGFPKKDQGENLIFFAGHIMEPVYREYIKKAYENKYEVLETDIQWASRKFPRFLFNIDGIVIDKETGEVGVLEIKHTAPGNTGVIRNWENGDLPKTYEMQGRAYTEGLDLDFTLFVLGYGNRVDHLVPIRIERDKVKAEEILTQAEAFIEDYIIKGVQPEYTTIKDPDQAKQAMLDAYGIDESKKLELDKPDLVAKYLEKKEELKTFTKEKEKPLLEEKQKIQDEMNSIMVEIIDIMKDAPEAFCEIDGKKHTISRYGRTSLDVAGVMAKYPDIYKDYQKPAIDTTKLKEERPDIYEEFAKKPVNSFNVK